MIGSRQTHLAVVGGACVAILLGVAFLLLHLTGPSDGTVLSPGQSVWRHDGVIVTPLQPGNLHQGDVVVAIEGKSLKSWADDLCDMGAARPQWGVGQTITYTIRREGHLLDVPVTLRTYPLGTVVMQEWSTILYGLVFLVVSVFVFLRRRDERAAQVQLLIGASMAGATTWSLGLQVGDLVNGIGFWLFTATTLGIYLLFWIAILHFALVFPRPYLRTVTWPSLIPLLYLVPYTSAFIAIISMRLQTSSTLDWIGDWGLVSGIIAPILLVLTLLVALWSYRTGSIAERKKIRWIMYAALLSGVGSLVLWHVPNLVGHPIISANALGLLVLPYPIALAIAILRYQLFDIDIIINRTLVYGTLVLIVIVFYVFLVSTVTMVVHPSSAFFPSLLATGVVAVIFQPLHARLQWIVNRLFYGERDDPYAVLSRLDARLEATLIPEAVLPTVVQTIVQALKVPYAAIALKHGETFGIAASYGHPQREVLSLPLVYHSETVGQLQLAPRGVSETFTTADRQLLAAIAAHVGIAAHAVRLTTDLQRSRERLVSTREEERRRLRRDLHDGLGPTLASMTLKLDAARNLLSQNSPALEPLLGELKSQTQTTIADIRRLVYDLRPLTLDELGLVSALREQLAHYSQASGMQIVLDAPVSLPMLPAAVEVATYRIVLEAVTNVMRHAQAHTCQVRLQVSDEVTVEVSDDGVGLPSEYAAGVGISSMRERSAELGGDCHIETSIAGGTRILVRLPLAKEEHMEHIRVLIADDHPVFREGLRTLLSSMPDTEVAGEVSTGDDAVAQAAALQPDVILMDLRMPGLNGIEATRTILRVTPNIGILVITMFEDDDSVFAAMRAGARGYLLKGADQSEIARAITVVSHGEAIFSPSIAERLTQYFAQIGSTMRSSHFPELTDREYEVLTLIAQGCSNAEMAGRLGVSPKTIRNHVSNIFNKLQVADRAQAIIRARDAGLK